MILFNKTADEAELKSAYKKAARKFHPDNAETGNEELFKKVGAAYEVLKDPQKRQIYDQYGAEGLKGAGGFGGAGAEGFGGFEDLGDIFSSFFGGGSGPTGPQIGQSAYDTQDAYAARLNALEGF
jgi:molecular chaperone DnaJ